MASAGDSTLPADYVLLFREAFPQLRLELPSSSLLLQTFFDDVQRLVTAVLSAEQEQTPDSSASASDEDSGDADGDDANRDDDDSNGEGSEDEGSDDEDSGDGDSDATPDTRARAILDALKETLEPLSRSASDGASSSAAAASSSSASAAQSGTPGRPYSDASFRELSHAELSWLMGHLCTYNVWYMEHLLAAGVSHNALDDFFTYSSEPREFVDTLVPALLGVDARLHSPKEYKQLWPQHSVERSILHRPHREDMGRWWRDRLFPPLPEQELQSRVLHAKLISKQARGLVAECLKQNKCSNAIRPIWRQATDRYAVTLRRAGRSYDDRFYSTQKDWSKFVVSCVHQKDQKAFRRIFSQQQQYVQRVLDMLIALACGAEMAVLTQQQAAMQFWQSRLNDAVDSVFEKQDLLPLVRLLHDGGDATLLFPESHGDVMQSTESTFKTRLLSLLRLSTARRQLVACNVIHNEHLVNDARVFDGQMDILILPDPQQDSLEHKFDDLADVLEQPRGRGVIIELKNDKIDVLSDAAKCKTWLHKIDFSQQLLAEAEHTLLARQRTKYRMTDPPTVGARLQEAESQVRYYAQSDALKTKYPYVSFVSWVLYRVGLHRILAKRCSESE